MKLRPKYLPQLLWIKPLILEYLSNSSKTKEKKTSNVTTDKKI